MKIKIRLGFDKELDGYDPDEVIAITFAEAKLNSIQARGGTLSNRFGVAKTANNKRVLGVLDEVRNQDNIPYQRHDCAVEVDGIPVFYGFALVEESSNRYYLRVYSGVSNFFEQVGKAMLNDPGIDWSDYDHVYSAVIVDGARINTTGYIYPNINYGRWTGDTVTSTGSRISFQEFFPALYLKDIFDTIAASYGYTMLNYTDGGRAIPFCRQHFNLTNSLVVKASCSSDTITRDTVNTENQRIEFPTIVGSDRVGIVAQVTSGTKDYTYIDFDDAEGSADVRAVISWSRGSETGSVTMSLVIETGGGTQSIINQQLPISSSGTAYYNASMDLDGSVVQRAYITLTAGTNGDTVTISDSSIEVIKASVKIDEGTAPWNGVYFEDIMPDISIKDLFMHEAAQRNALVIVDPDDRTIEFLSFNDIAASAPIAKDWSKKVDHSEDPIIEFRFMGYAQNNYLRYGDAPEEDLPNATNPNLGRGELLIVDDSLPPLADMYVSPFVASGMATAFDGQPYMLFIPRYSTTSIDIGSPDIDPRPRICTLDINNDHIVWITGGGANTTQPNATFEGFQESIDTNYTALSAALTKTKIAEVLVRLNAVDILELDFTKPVYLLNEYWFIREVMQWKANRADSTIVKLLRL